MNKNTLLSKVNKYLKQSIDICKNSYNLGMSDKQIEGWNKIIKDLIDIRKRVEKSSETAIVNNEALAARLDEIEKAIERRQMMKLAPDNYQLANQAVPEKIQKLNKVRQHVLDLIATTEKPEIVVRLIKLNEKISDPSQFESLDVENIQRTLDLITKEQELNSMMNPRPRAEGYAPKQNSMMHSQSKGKGYDLEESIDDVMFSAFDGMVDHDAVKEREVKAILKKGSFKELSDTDLLILQDYYQSKGKTEIVNQIGDILNSRVNSNVNDINNNDRINNARTNNQIQTNDNRQAVSNAENSNLLAQLDRVNGNAALQNTIDNNRIVEESRRDSETTDLEHRQNLADLRDEHNRIRNRRARQNELDEVNHEDAVRGAENQNRINNLRREDVVRDAETQSAINEILRNEMLNRENHRALTERESRDAEDRVSRQDRETQERIHRRTMDRLELLESIAGGAQERAFIEDLKEQYKDAKKNGNYDICDQITTTIDNIMDKINNLSIGNLNLLEGASEVLSLPEPGME